MSDKKYSTFATEVLLVDDTARSLNSDKYILGDALLDGEFEIWTDANNPRYWTAAATSTSEVDREGTTKYAGTYGVKLAIAASNNNASVAQAFNLIPGRDYILKLRYQNSTSAKTAKVTIADSGSNVYLLSTGLWKTSADTISLTNSNAAWTLYTLSFKAHSSYSAYTITLANNSAASSNIFFDSAKIVEANLNLGFPRPAHEAEVSLESAPIRYTTGGISPTTVVGTAMNPTDAITLKSFDDIRTFKGIRSGSTSGILTVSYKR
jgi:hypothetical protein